MLTTVLEDVATLRLRRGDDTDVTVSVIVDRTVSVSVSVFVTCFMLTDPFL